MADEPTDTISLRESGPYPDRLLPGMKVGDYVIEAPIASGGCGTVYRAHHAMLGRMILGRKSLQIVKLKADKVDRHSS